MKRMQETVDDDRHGGLGQGQSDIPFTQASGPREISVTRYTVGIFIDVKRWWRPTVAWAKARWLGG